MIDQTIHDLERRIRNANLTPIQRQELQKLVDSLREEVGELAKTHRDEADSIVSFARVAASEGLRVNHDPRLVDIAVAGVRASVQKFEKTHPVLTMTANGLATFFSNLGI